MKRNEAPIQKNNTQQTVETTARRNPGPSMAQEADDMSSLSWSDQTQATNTSNLNLPGFLLVDVKTTSIQVGSRRKRMTNENIQEKVHA